MSRTVRKPSHRLFKGKKKVKDGTPTRACHSCENNGSCEYCRSNRLHKHRKQPQLEDFKEDM